ncbi:MAG: SpoIIE family protein phosphatase [Candidatus Eremiobacteraeota bacterium]|nr:SpoIIE family protein phosphatase [Candidatus Eremiobacteraeota bacterium]MBV8644568.1 SpoIIE family protein phosphatase [Candidatus Eremiobacteraeota bacterium]
MRVDLASRAPHARKHGTTFAESWQSADGATIVAVGSVPAGIDPVVVSDLLRTGARALVTSSKALGIALGAMDRVVRNHAREHRDDDLAAAVVLFAFAPDGQDLDVAGAGQLHAALIDGSGKQHPLHGRGGALGTGIEPKDLVEHVHLRRDDLVVAATVALDHGWWDSGLRTAEALLHRADAHDASAAVVARE